MSSEPGVLLCAYRMQACCRGDEACPVNRVVMGDSVESVAEAAEECLFAGGALDVGFYRSLTYRERQRRPKIIQQWTWEELGCQD